MSLPTNLTPGSQWVLRKSDPIADSLTHIYLGKLNRRYEFALLAGKHHGQVGSGSLTLRDLVAITPAPKERQVPQKVVKAALANFTLVQDALYGLVATNPKPLLAPKRDKKAARAQLTHALHAFKPLLKAS